MGGRPNLAVVQSKLKPRASSTSTVSISGLSDRARVPSFQTTRRSTRVHVGEGAGELRSVALGSVAHGVEL